MKRTFETTEEQEEALTLVFQESNSDLPDSTAYILARINDVLNSYVVQKLSETAQKDRVIAEKDVLIEELQAQLAEAKKEVE